MTFLTELKFYASFQIVIISALLAQNTGLQNNQQFYCRRILYTYLHKYLRQNFNVDRIITANV